MQTDRKDLALATSLGITVAVVLSIAMFVLGIRFVIPVLLALAAIAVGVSTTYFSRGRPSRAASIIVAVGSFALTAFALNAPLANDRTRQVHKAVWREGAPPELRESEVILDFVDFPGFAVHIYSTDLRNHLRTVKDNQVAVEYQATLEWKCPNRLYIERVAGYVVLGDQLREVYSSETPSRTPWRPKWWCALRL